MSLDAGHSNSTRQAVKAMNAADNVEEKIQPVRYNKPAEELTPSERKQEYYALLDTFLAPIVDITRKLRGEYPLGLVRRTNEQGSGLVSSLQADFAEKMREAADAGDFLKASYWVHDEIANSIAIATEMWAHDADWNSPDLARLSQLVDSHRREVYGSMAAQKRIASAMAQTLHISGSFERLSYDFFGEQNGRSPTGEEARTMHRNNLKTAVRLTELHLERTREIRPVVGAESEKGGSVHRYSDPQHFYLNGESLELKPASLPEAMNSRPVDTSDGRIGCPGVEYIPEIWEWIEEVSQRYSYPILDASKR